MRFGGTSEFDAELVGERVFLVVAQKPFEIGENLFCTLKPILMDDGSETNAEDFPDANGLVWWMVLPNTRKFAEPGRLVTAILEPSREIEKPDKSWYQVKVDSVESPHASWIVEIIDAPSNWVSDPREIVSSGYRLPVDHPPMEKVYVAWRDSIYGPLRTDTAWTLGEEGQYRVSFSPGLLGNLVNKIPVAELRKLPPDRLRELDLRVSQDSRAPDGCGRESTCSFRLVMQSDFARFVEPASSLIVLEPEENLLKRLAKDFLTRKERQEFNRLLDRIGDQIKNRPSDGDGVAERVVKALVSKVQSISAAADELARALLESGSLEERIKPLLVEAEARHVEQHAVKLQAEVDAKVGQARSELESLERDRDDRKQKLEQELSRQKVESERDLTEQRQKFEREREAELGRLRTQKQELDRQSVALSGNLKEVVRQMTEGRDGLVNQFLAIAPLLERFGMIAGAAQSVTPPATLEAPAPEDERAGFKPPTFAIDAPPGREVGEREFYDRLREHVERSGYRYRSIDLAGFHLSVKCNDLTVLGGPPGTGKSSLPRLYAETLVGEGDDQEGRSYLHVGVSPSWLDMRDLLGQANLLDHSFQPAESGLYPRLVWAGEEQRTLGPDSRMYIVCLDEMNLAQVEHYFSGFLSALERAPGQREIPCFGSWMVRRDDSFAAWPTLNLPPSVRFVGTVNFDETTRQLSQRVLDRCNLIRLRSDCGMDADPPRKHVAQGPAITQRAVAGWVKESAGLAPAQGAVLDNLREPLLKMGCPLYPRRFRAIRQVLGNTPAFVCSADQALDLQIAQRVLPQVRNLFRPGAREGLKGFRRILEAAPHGFPESLALLDEIEERETGDDFSPNGPDE